MIKLIRLLYMKQFFYISLWNIPKNLGKKTIKIKWHTFVKTKKWGYMNYHNHAIISFPFISKSFSSIYSSIKRKGVKEAVMQILWCIHKSGVLEPAIGSIMRVIIQAECQNYYQRTFSESQSFCFLLNKQCSTQKWQTRSRSIWYSMRAPRL